MAPQQKEGLPDEAGGFPSMREETHHPEEYHCQHHVQGYHTIAWAPGK